MVTRCNSDTKKSIRNSNLNSINIASFLQSSLIAAGLKKRSRYGFWAPPNTDVYIRKVLGYNQSNMLDVAIDAARQGGELALKYFKTQPKVSYKADKSPVTRADIEAEKLIRKIITKKFPDHGIIGEELPPVNPKAKYQWVIDPIDGTRDFIRGIPFWNTFLAVLKDKKPIIGIIFTATYDELFVAQHGKGTYLNNKKTKVSKISDLKLACISHGPISVFKKKGKLKGLVKICDIVKHRRGFGSIGLNLLLKDQVDIFMEPGGGTHDFAAPSILIEEAGGNFSDFSGKSSLTSGCFVATNGILHDQVIRLLNQ